MDIEYCLINAIYVLRIIFTILSFTFITTLQSQSTEVLVSTEFVDFVDFKRIDDNRYAGIYNRRESSASGLFWSNYDNIREEVDGVFSYLCIYNSESGTYNKNELESPSNKVIRWTNIYVDNYSESLIVSQITHNQDSLEAQNFVRLDYDLNVIDSFDLSIPNEIIEIISQNPITGEYIGGSRNIDWTMHPIKISSDFISYEINESFLMNYFPFHQFIYNPSTWGYLYSDSAGGKYFFDSNLNLVSECPFTFFLEGGSDEAVVLGPTDMTLFTGGYSTYYDEITLSQTDVEVIFRSDLNNCSYDTLYSYIPPDSANMTSAQYVFDALYQSHIYNSIYYESGNNCVILEVNDCSSYFTVTSINNEGELNWRKFLGGDAYYAPHRLVATSDSGALLIVQTFNLIDNDNEFDSHYIKFDKDGNVEPNFLSPFLSTDILEFEVYNALVYPNPASDYLYIQSDKNYHLVELQIFDMNGRLLQCEHALPSDKIDIRHLSSGAYTFILEGDSKELRSGKFIKE